MSKIKVSRNTVGAGILAGFSAYGVFSYIRGVQKPRLYFNPAGHLLPLLDNTEALWEDYWPSFGSTNVYNKPDFPGHFSTIVAMYGREQAAIAYQRERVPMGDGAVYIDWAYRPDSSADTTRNLVLILPGLNGGSHSVYARGLIQWLHSRGYDCCVMNNRGFNDTVLESPKTPAASWTEDLRALVAAVHHRLPGARLYGVGFSMGGNVLVKYLGEEGERALLAGAVCVSNPFDLTGCSQKIKSGPYDWSMVSGLKSYVARHKEVLSTDDRLRPGLHQLNSIKTVWDFDNQFTRVIHDFSSVEEYYDRGSSAHYVSRVAVPLLALNALDDPIVNGHTLPYDACEQSGENFTFGSFSSCRPDRQSPWVCLCITDKGGHVGYPQGHLRPTGSWADTVIAQWFDQVRSQPLPQH